MAQKKISELSEMLSEIDNNDVFVVNREGKTKRIKASNLAQGVLELFAEDAPAALHNAVKRGKYLGNKLTVEQAAEIANGTFHDLWLGDYWTINGTNYRIGGINYWLNTGDTACTLNHLLITPDEPLYEAAMNSGGTVEGAYVGSDMYKTNLEKAKKMINAAFGEAHILNHREWLADTVNNNLISVNSIVYELNGAWYDSTVDLMNEIMVYGSNIYHNILSGVNLPEQHTEGRGQIPLFGISPENIKSESYWLRDVVGYNYMTRVSKNGHANYQVVTQEMGVRPVFGITG
jgi:hypothetical protein